MASIIILENRMLFKLKEEQISFYNYRSFMSFKIHNYSKQVYHQMIMEFVISQCYYFNMEKFPITLLKILCSHCYVKKKFLHVRLFAHIHRRAHTYAIAHTHIYTYGNNFLRCLDLVDLSILQQNKYQHCVKNRGNPLECKAQFSLRHPV